MEGQIRQSEDSKVGISGPSSPALSCASDRPPKPSGRKVIPGHAGLRSITSGITLRVTQLAWTVTLATLCIFIGFIIPEQRRGLQRGLESKAHGIAAALQGEVAGAAVTEDYSSVVEQAMQVVAGDPEVQFLVVAKSDGYAVVIRRDGWRAISNIAPEWHEGPRIGSSKIGLVPLEGKRLFHYSTPFDYSGIPWGWVHVGLSLDSYDQNVKDIYVRTGILGALCIALSLMVSILFAKRFVKPILTLQGVVENVAHGNLEARATIRSGDEIERLANAFNEMADAILQRDEIVETVRFAAQALQETDNWKAVVEEILLKIGQATKVCRVLLIQHEYDKEAVPIPRIQFEWEYQGIGRYGSLWSGRNIQELGLAQRREFLLKGDNLIEHRDELEASPIPGPKPKPLSIIAAPIFADSVLWGELVVHDCFEDREWRDVEQNSVRAIADMMGACVVRQEAKTALVEAKNGLERRVLERTLELRDEIEAKDKAHTELQLMQKQLIEASRLSGMAEVATGVLHNVGNVLNSVNVSATLLMDHMSRSRVQQLQELSRMMAQHTGSFDQFLNSDPRGQRVIPYLSKLSTHLLEERNEMRKEAETLVQNVGHIKEVVAMQQNYARTYGVLEKVAPQELINDAVNISGPAIDRHKIILKREIEDVQPLMTDRHKILQILLNLIQNAKDAVKAGNSSPRQVTLRLRAVPNNRVCFEVEDNGIGIRHDDLTRIFSHGFTTKKSGHGFGLHSGALAASQLGGSLKVRSAGLGLGAVFALEIPANAEGVLERAGAN